jgi:hypothetical protein
MRSRCPGKGFGAVMKSMTNVGEGVFHIESFWTQKSCDQEESITVVMTHLPTRTVAEGTSTSFKVPPAFVYQATQLHALDRAVDAMRRKLVDASVLADWTTLALVET